MQCAVWVGGGWGGQKSVTFERTYFMDDPVPDGKHNKTSMRGGGGGGG